MTNIESQLVVTLCDMLEAFPLSSQSSRGQRDVVRNAHAIVNKAHARRVPDWIDHERALAGLPARQS